MESATVTSIQWLSKLNWVEHVEQVEKDQASSDLFLMELVCANRLGVLFKEFQERGKIICSYIIIFWLVITTKLVFTAPSVIRYQGPAFSICASCMKIGYKNKMALRTFIYFIYVRFIYLAYNTLYSGIGDSVTYS